MYLIIFKGIMDMTSKDTVVREMKEDDFPNVPEPSDEVQLAMEEGILEGCRSVQDMIYKGNGATVGVGEFRLKLEGLYMQEEGLAKVEVIVSSSSLETLDPLLRV